jgi:ParB family chromosome partitioning protein
MATSKKRGLGRGLDALLSVEPTIPSSRGPESHESRESVELEGKQILSVSIERLRPGIHQPRSEFNDEELEELAESVRRHGVLQPILVNPSGDGYEIVAGERRWRAARMAGLPEVPAIVVNAAEEASLEIAVIENIQRSDLNPMEEAAAYESMMTRLSLTQEEVAARVGKERSTVANYVRLLKLPNQVQESVALGSLSMGHARAILALRDEGEMVKFARVAEKSRLSVRQLEGRIRKALAGSTHKSGRYAVSSKEAGPSGPQALFLREMAENMRSALGTKVSIQGDEKKGQVVIEYYSVEILEGIADRLSGRH